MTKMYVTIRSIVTAVLVVASLQLLAQNATLTGKVTNAEGALAGATVTAGAKGAATDASGNYSLSLPAGQYTVKASYVGYQTVSETITLQAGATQTLDFTLQEVNELNTVVVLGNRAAPRTQIETPVPVDVIDVKKVASSAPQVTVNQILNYAVPSFSANTQSLADGTDHIDPASIRGLGPDQVLVLVNGKRRHTSALININGSFGKGSVGTDLNAIPVSAIDRIEILRDGASAQYGSDAIAGVINIILKKSVNTVEASVTAGQYFTTANGEKKRDGNTVQAAINYGLPIGQNGGFVNFSGTYDLRQPTDRGGARTDAIYRRYPGGVDMTDSFLAATGTTRKDYSLRVGQSRLRSGQFMFNSSIPVSENTEFYAFGGLGYRNGLAPGFYRLPNESRNVLDIYPLGFLPYIGSDIYDRSVAAGIRGKAGAWDVDFSNTFGQNEFDFNVQNSLNASMGKSSPTSFRAGGPKFTQNTTNVDIARNFDWLAGFNLSYGGEFRFERYQLIPGEAASYTNYGTATQVGVDANGQPILIPDPKGPINTLFGPDGSPRPGGSQVFPGFRPENAVNATRTAVAGYVDGEFNFTKAFLADAAVRYENYSDFGSNTSGKIALRYKVTNQFAIRASANTGFRAPSLHQRYFANTSTVFTNGVANEVGTFPNNSRVAQLLGIPSLKPETSKSVSAGFTGNIKGIKVTLDGYITHIDNRIVYTDQFSGNPAGSDADKEIYQLLTLANATRAAFFANAINTDTRGIDLVISYAKRIGAGNLRADLAATTSKTVKVGDVHTSSLLKGKESIYFSEANRIYLEQGVPHDKLTLGLDYTIKNVEVFLRNDYFGGVEEATSTLQYQQFYTPKWVTDFTVGYTFVKGLKATIGANNLFDVYPDKIAFAANTSSGQFVYPRSVQQFGFNGRYLFARLEVKL